MPRGRDPPGSGASPNVCKCLPNTQAIFRPYRACVPQREVNALVCRTPVGSSSCKGDQRRDAEPLSACNEFITGLEPAIQQFIFEAVLAHELLRPEYLKLYRASFPVRLVPNPSGNFMVETNEKAPSDPDEFIRTACELL